MKELWIKIEDSLPNNIKNDLLKSAAQACDTVAVSRRDIKNAKKTGIKVASSSGDCNITVLESLDEKKISELKKVGKAVAANVTINRGEDEETVVKAANLLCDYIILKCTNWKVIPLENLIAKVKGRSKLLAEVSSASEAKLALETLESGADGVLLKAFDVDELAKTAIITKKQAPKLDLVPVKVVEMTQIGTAARVCVDTCDLMKAGEGILVGCQCSGLFLVQAEVHENPFIETRPFRVNAGPVSLYVLSSLTRTRYLSELKAGDEIVIVNMDGNVRPANLARVKIEWRPMVLIEAEHERKRLKTIVQNAETIRLVTRKGSISVAELKTGDEILAHVTMSGRHFGTIIEEKVIER